MIETATQVESGVKSNTGRLNAAATRTKQVTKSVRAGVLFPVSRLIKITMVRKPSVLLRMPVTLDWSLKIAILHR